MFLNLDKVTKVFKTGTFGGQDLHAVEDVDFGLTEGEFVSLIGESGSGKSTIGRMILRLTSVTSGVIEYRGKDISEFRRQSLKDYYRQVQGVFQEPFSAYNPIFKADRVFRNVKDEFFPEMDNGRWQDKVQDSLGAVGLNPDQVLGNYPHQLSGGQLQRFLIARALLLDIDFLVADEIISMLDASTRIDVLNLLADLKEREGLSILFITHDLSLGYYISERAMILYSGRILEKGVTEKIFRNPLHPYTKLLMASVPRIDKKWEEVEAELEEKQSDIDSGCVYRDRCSFQEKCKQCEEARPELREVEENHYVACHAQEED
ncbi:ABC transporter ATP-binding protein [Candidatus Bipolaricaulota bacterium]|nr:ABC transporter ATP-binding protein [Candidatus Bipolaricaulota bacterium]